MLLSVLLLLVVGLFDVYLGTKRLWSKRKLLSALFSLVTIIVSLYLLLISVVKQQFFIVLLVFIALYQLFNLYRLAKSQINQEHLRRITLRSGFRLWLVQLLVAALGLFIYYYEPTFDIELALAVFSYVFGLSLLASTWRSKNVTQAVGNNSKLLPSNDLPTLTVAIPARDESDSLLNCLGSILKNDYPKLEVFVLDDSSTDRRTPEIIRSFAHDGVEFIPGKEFNEEWLAKNWAYQQLLEAANGEIILFCGADVHFSEDSLRFLVSSLVSRDKQMLSILPNNELSSSIWRRFYQPLRYAWEISIPRRALHRPPVLSTCWVARREFLNNSGGFKAVSRRISPESYFAKQALKSDGYSFFHYEGVLSQKYSSAQFETSVRLRYPQLRRQVESVMLAALVELLGGLASLVLIILAILSLNWLVLFLALFAYFFIGVAFCMLLNLTYGKKLLSGILLWPLYLVLDIYLMHLSMWRYELGVVLWKGRSITPSVMNHEPQPNA